MKTFLLSKLAGFFDLFKSKPLPPLPPLTKPSVPPPVRFLTIVNRNGDNEILVDNQPFLKEEQDESGMFTWSLPKDKKITLQPMDGDWLIVRRDP